MRKCNHNSVHFISLGQEGGLPEGVLQAFSRISVPLYDFCDVGKDDGG
jgi:hypothetical protein